MVGFARGQGEVMQTPGPASLRNDYKNKVIKHGTGWAGNLREHKGQTYLTYLLCESRTPIYAFRYLVQLMAEYFLNTPNFNL